MVVVTAIEILTVGICIQIHQSDIPYLYRFENLELGDTCVYKSGLFYYSFGVGTGILKTQSRPIIGTPTYGI